MINSAQTYAFCCRLITVDHATKDVYLVALHTVDSSATSDAQSWLDRTIKSLQTLAAEVQADGNKAILAKAKEQDPRPLDMSPVSVQGSKFMHSGFDFYVHNYYN